MWATDYTWTFTGLTGSKNGTNMSKDGNAITASTSNGMDLLYYAGTGTESRVFTTDNATTVAEVNYTHRINLGGNGDLNQRYFTTGALSGSGTLYFVGYNNASENGTVTVYNNTNTNTSYGTMTVTGTASKQSLHITNLSNTSLRICMSFKAHVYAIIWVQDTEPSDSNPIDMTSKIVDPGFEGIIVDGSKFGTAWDWKKSTGSNGPKYPNSDETSTASEFWKQDAADLSFTISQTITGLSAGTYKLTAKAKNDLNSAPTTNTTGRAFLFANNTGTTIADNATVLGCPSTPVNIGADFSEYSVIFTMDGTKDLTIGFKTMGVMDARWFVCDDFTLEYYGTSSSKISTSDATNVKYSVTFDKGTNGSCETTYITEESYGAGVQLPTVNSNDGYKFEGWSTNSSPSSADAGKAKYYPASNCTLYAYYTTLQDATIPTIADVTCEVNDDITLTGSATATNGGTINPISGGFNSGKAYRWSTCNADGSGISWISGEVNTTYKPSTTTRGKYYYRFMCVENVANQQGYKTTYSNVITVTVQGTNSITITAQPTGASYTQFATPTALSVTATVGSGTCTYQWQSSTNNSDFSNISNATSATYTPATTAVGTMYYRCVVSATDCESVTSNVATITVNGGSSTVNDLTEITPSYTYTPSASIPAGTLVEDGKIICATGGCDYKSGYGLNFKSNRYIAIKVPANATIIVEAGNHGTNGARSIQLGSSTSSLTNLSTLEVAQGATGTLTYKYEAGGIVYLSASADLYLKKLTVTNGYTLTIHLNGHASDDETFYNQTNIENPMRVPEADGYTFVGWYTDEACTKAAVAGATLTENTDLYAKWTINKGYTIPFDGNGITVTEDHLVEPQRGMGVMLPTAYETVTDIDIPANEESNWTFASSVSGKGLYKETIREAFFNISVPAGNVLTQQVTGLAAGKYEVVLDVAASATNLRDFKTDATALPTGNNLTQAFASSGSNEAAKYIPVLNRTEINLNNEEYDRIALVVNVTDGTLTYGIKNTVSSGNWYICRVHSIKKVDDTNFTGWNTKADGSGTSYTAGTNLSPEYNGTILYAQWNKTYTFRPVASNGTLVSVTVNGENVSATNNHDITVLEEAVIVMTVTPATGYKFKNWVLTSGGTAGAESTSNSNYIYTISSITANTTVTAKFEALGTGTDPNPANGTLSDATVTINSFPASYAGQTQSIDLNLPTGATFVVTSGNANVVDGKLSVTVPNSLQSTDINITVTAEAGNTQTYTVHISTVEGASYSYTVKAVDGSGNVLKTITTGVYAQGTGAITIAYPHCILKDGTIYETSHNNDNYYRQSITPDKDGYVLNITYTSKRNNVIYFTEAEDIAGMTQSKNDARASYLLGRCSNYIPTITLPVGTYSIYCRGVNSNEGNQTFSFKAGDTEILNVSLAKSDYNTKSGEFTISQEITISVQASGSSSSGLDWFYIQNKKILPVTVDGQKLGLTKEIVEATSYTTANPTSTAAKEETKGDITGHFYDIKNSDNNITITEKGATSFEVFAYHNNTSATRTLDIYNGDTKLGSISVEPGKTCSSGIIAFDSKSEAKTITLKGAGSDVFPAYIVFYTRPMLNVLTSTIKMGKGKQDIALSTTTGSGTIAMTTPSSATSAIVTATFESNTLSLTPVKAGTAKLAFTITDDGVEYPVEYTVNVVKQIPTITYRANNKVTYNATATSATDFVSPTAVVKDEDGNDVTSSVSLIYISDDETLVTFNSSNASLIPNIQGSAKLKCVLYNNDTYENAMATFTVNITAGIDKKLYTLNSSGDKVGNDVPAINDKLVAEDESGNTLMSMIYGGYKYGRYTHFSGKTDKGSDGKADDNKVGDTWKGDKGTDTQFNAYGGQGTDIYGNRLDNEIDDYGFQTQAQYDSRDEYNKGIEWFKTTDVKTNGTYYTEYERIKPFSLPCKGAYLKFEAEVNGTLTAYVLQNGNVTFSSEEGMRDKPKVGDALGGNPRIYYWFDQDGYRITPTSFASKQPLTIGRDYNADVATELADWYNTYSGLKEYLETNGGWPTQAQVNANLQKPVPDPQPVVRFQEGYMVAQKAYVKYVLPVVAGNTYYFFSNNSKVGVAGYNFLPDEDGTVSLILPEGGRLDANTQEGTKALNTTTDIATTHKTTGLIEMYKTVTLPRQFKQNTWSTICLPFHVTESQVEKVFGKGTNLIIYNGCAQIGGHNTARFQKHVNQDILAGQPYLIYPTGEGVIGITNEWIGGDGTNITGLTFHNVNFTPNVAVQSYASDKDGTLGDDGYGTENPDYKFIGTLGKTTVNKYDYYINNKTGALTRYTGNGTTLNAYYGYLKNTAETPSSAKAISALSFENFEEEEEDIPTGLLEVLINDMGINIAPVDGVYNLSGQKVADSTENLPKGIYIVNGKKVSIK